MVLGVRQTAWGAGVPSQAAGGGGLGAGCGSWGCGPQDPYGVPLHPPSLGSSDHMRGGQPDTPGKMGCLGQTLITEPSKEGLVLRSRVEAPSVLSTSHGAERVSSLGSGHLK